MKIICVIPARYSSTRLPGKALALIAGKPMIRHVYERACQAKYPEVVIVATDNKKIYDTVTEFGGMAVMTAENHPTGTDRLAEVALKFPDADLIINVQGDEPLIEPEVIDNLAEAFLSDKSLVMATMATPMPIEDYDNPGAVKVVTDKNGFALYFSRSLIPYPRYAETELPVYLHLGIYAYDREFLLKYAALPPAPLEKIEALEQLRALEYGYRIKVLKTGFHSIGVDTPEDLERVKLLLKNMR